MTQIHKYLGDILVQEKILSQRELEEAIEKSKIRNLSLEETLFRLGYISRDRLGELYAHVFESEYVTNIPRPVPNEVLGLMSPETALELQVVPYRLEDDTLSVLMAGPLESRSFEDLLAECEARTGKRVRIDFCSLSHLKEMLQKYYGSPEKTAPAAPTFSSVVESIKSDLPDAGLRSEFEELYDVGQTALIGARSHPFNKAVAASIEEAKQKLNDARKYMDSSFEEEAVQMARQAVQLLKDATAKADTVEKDWDKLVQQVKALRTKVNTLEEQGAPEFAASEFKELSEIHESLIECINDRNVDRLRYLLDQGTIIIERIGLLSPNRNKGREEVMASLAQVRQVIARARKAGAKEHAPEALAEAYGFLDRAEGSARRARWDEVRSLLSSAEEKAVESEQLSIRAAEETRQLTLKLRESIRAASAVLEEAMANPFAQESIEELLRAKDSIAEAKACFDDGRQKEGISLAEQTAERIRNLVIPFIKESERRWNELFGRADKSSAKIRTLDIPLMMKLSPMKVEALLHAERDMVAALCRRDQSQLANAVLVCERLLEEVSESYVEATDQLQHIQTIVARAADLLTSAASSGIDAEVAPAFVEAGLLLENARKNITLGNTESATRSAETAVEHLREKVIEPQRRVRELWSDLVLQAAGLLEEAGQVISLDSCYRCPKQISQLYTKLADLVGALASREPEALQNRVLSLKEILGAIRKEAASAQKQLHESVTAELREIEQSVKKAVEKCSGYYAPDALESVYLDIKRLWETLSDGPAGLDAISEIEAKRDLAVARAKLWQVEFLRERFEKEREEDLRQLRLKMNGARDEIEDCAKMDFIGPDSLMLQEARSLIEQAENLLIEGGLDESFDLVRQCQSLVVNACAEVKEQERQWSELAQSLQAEQADFRKILRNPMAQESAPQEFDDLFDLVENIPDIVGQKDLKALMEHCDQLDSLCAAIEKRVEQAQKELREEAEGEIRKAEEKIRLAGVLHAEKINPDVFHAACSFSEIARKYLQEAEYIRALDSAADALAKASEAVVLGKAGIERAGALAADYMKIASNHIAQGNTAAAEEALQKGLSLVSVTRISEPQE